MSKNRKRCAIIGAGASGLPCIRWALLYGIEPVCFEAADFIGGIWKYRKDGPSVMKSTIINTSKEMTAYSDFPPPLHFANYMHHSEFLEYLELYAKNFDLYRYIRFKHFVVSIKRAEDYEESGKWSVQYVDDDGIEIEEVFDCVILAQGHNSLPNFENVKFRGQEKFKGRIIHSGEYKEPTEEYMDKVNVVVGIGNSAVDIAVELSRIGKKTYLSTRRGAYIFNRVGPYGWPSDLAKSRFNTYYKSYFIPKSWQKRMLINRLQSRFDLVKYGLAPSEDIYAKHATLNDELPNRIISGTLSVKPNIREFTETGIIWDDGTAPEPVHNFILATGYLYNFDIVENGSLIPVIDNYTEMYKYIYPKKTLDHCTLGIVGLIQPTGAIINTAEMQARFFFHVFANMINGIHVLPTLEKMSQEIEAKEMNLRTCFKLHLQRFWVDYLKYMDELADMIGCKPNPWVYLFKDFDLFYALMFNASVAYGYRLKGPHSWNGAREAILSVEERVIAPLMTRKVANLKTTETKSHTKIYLLISSSVISILLYKFWYRK